MFQSVGRQRLGVCAFVSTLVCVCATDQPSVVARISWFGLCLSGSER